MTLDTNAKDFVYYRALGTDMHLLAPGQKKHNQRPAVVTTDWDDKIKEHVRSGGNLGFSPQSADLLIVDIDTKRVDGKTNFKQLLTKHGIKLPRTRSVQTPSGGWHLYYSRAGYPYRLWSHLRDCPGVDFLSGACNVVCAGSALGEGAYAVDIDIDIAPAPVELLDLLRMSSAASPGDLDPTVSEDVLEFALETLPNDDAPYDDYLAVGMAIHFETGGADRGLDMWKAWASKSLKYLEIDCARRWASFSTSGSEAGVCRFGTIDRLRKEFTKPSFASVEEAQAYIASRQADECGEEDSRIGRGGAPKQTGAPTAAAQLDPPGLLGRIAEYILSVSISPLPEAALLASLNLVSLLSRNRYTVAGSTRLNLYSLLAARTGAGKDAAFAQVSRILAAMGESKHLASGVTSGPALRKYIAKVPGHCLSLHIDEASRWLSACNMAGGAGKHDVSIRFETMELYSKAGSVLPGRIALTPSGKVDERCSDAIRQPFLAMLLATTPERLMQSLQSIDFADGFLNRMLVLRTDRMPVLRDEVDSSRPVPEDLIAELRGLALAWDPIDEEEEEDDEGGEEKGNRAARLAEPEEPIDIPLASGVREKHRSLLDSVRGDGIPIPDLWQRVPEIVMKVAGIAAVGMGEDNRIVTHDIYDWSYTLVHGAFATLVKSIEREHAESADELLCKQILQFLADGSKASEDKRWSKYCSAGAKPLALVTRRFYRVPKRTRDAAIETLIEAGLVEEAEVTAEGSHKPMKLLVTVE